MNIAIDLDDTLINFADQLIKFHNFVFDTHYNFNDFHTYVFYKVWGGDKDTNKNEVNKFYLSPHFKAITPLPGASDAIAKLSKHNELFIITARNDDVSELTKKQVHSLFPESFKEVHFVGTYHLKNKPIKSKAEMCDELDIDVLIEDSVDNANESVKFGRKIFLFNRPWNIKRETNKEVIRVDSWYEILEKLQVKC